MTDTQTAPTTDISEHLRGPWRVILSNCGEVFDSLDGLPPDAWVDITICRGTALPDEDGFLPGTCKAGDEIELYRDLYVEDGDPSTDAPARWAQAQAMAAGLNAAARG